MGESIKGGLTLGVVTPDHASAWRRAAGNGLVMRTAETTESPSQNSGATHEPLWTSQDVADFLQVSLRWVEKQRALGTLPCVPLPGRRLVRYDPERVRAWALQRGTSGRG